MNLIIWMLSAQLAAAIVLPPTNVTLHCRNLKNTVEWTYGQPFSGLRFRVDIGSLRGLDASRSPLWVDPPTLQADVSFLSDPSDDYLLTVTAVNGLEESETVPTEGIIFSYFQDSQAKKKCYLDIPPVNVTAVEDDKVQFRFIHPWVFYHQNLLTRSKSKPQKKKRHDALTSENLPLFLYEVKIFNQADDKPHLFACDESVCEDQLPVDAEQEKHCLRIKGELKKMHIQAAQDYCALSFKRTADKTLTFYSTIYIVASLLVLVIAVLILFMVYRKKTNSSTALPPTLNISKQVKQGLMGIVRETVVVPGVEPTSPLPLLSETKGNESTHADTPFTDSDFQLPIGVSTQNDRVCDVTEVGQKDDNYMQGTNLDEDETETQNSFEGHSSYEKREILVELAPGEQAEGYRGGK